MRGLTLNTLTLNMKLTTGATLNLDFAGTDIINQLHIDGTAGKELGFTDDPEHDGISNGQRFLRLVATE